jgi:hypothetical protein
MGKYYLVFSDQFPDGKIVSSAQIMNVKLDPYSKVVEIEDKYTAKLVGGVVNEELPKVDFVAKGNENELA